MTYDQWKLATPPWYDISPEEEAALEAERECQHCNGIGRVEVFHCKGVCECGLCPDMEDCPECCGNQTAED